ncbi:MAG TPA: GtrA family protein [Rhodopila sp.]|jgi:putative flippase GtrA
MDLAVAVQFIRFGIVGIVGLAVDTATVYGFRWSLGLYGAGLLAYLFAASVTWLLNRMWTFRGRGNVPAHRQWALFLAANLVGFVLNRGTYILLVTLLPIAAAQPVIATASGSLAGMFVNFALSRRIVFR